MTSTANIGTSGGNKTASEIHLGTSGGNKQASEGWIGTATGNKQFFGSSFAGAVNTYDTPGTSSELVPLGSVSVDIELWGAGAGGGKSDGVAWPGAGGAYLKLTRAVLSSEWGTAISFTVGTGGAGRSASSLGFGTSGSASTASGTLNGSAFSSSAGGGTNANVGGTASGDLTTSGSGGAGNVEFNNTFDAGYSDRNGGDAAGSGGSGGLNWDGHYDTELMRWFTTAPAEAGSAPGGGGGCGFYDPPVNSAGASGANGRVKFTWS